MRQVLLISAFVYLATLTSICPAPASAQEPQVDSWFGTLDVGAIKLRLRIDVKEAAQGERSADPLVARRHLAIEPARFDGFSGLGSKS